MVWNVSPLCLDAMDMVGITACPMMCLEVVVLCRTFMTLFIGVVVVEAMVGVVVVEVVVIIIN